LICAGYEQKQGARARDYRCFHGYLILLLVSWLKLKNHWERRPFFNNGLDFLLSGLKKNFRIKAFVSGDA
jgi:hypothetical protein